MFAETVYTIYKSLPEAEKTRFIAMLQKELKVKEKPRKKKTSDVKSKEEYLDIVYRILSNRKKRTN
ncbi:hypothetical protein [Flavobacterium sp.]|uniref:hypothetical protein n=1 Tax=Flavobacterium sp. TaxID=239 RepID=UPI0040483FE7